MSKHKLRIRSEKRNKLHKMKEEKQRGGKEMKNYGADFTKEVTGDCEWCRRDTSDVIDVCSESLSLFKVHLVWYK